LTRGGPDLPPGHEQGAGPPVLVVPSRKAAADRRVEGAPSQPAQANTNGQEVKRMTVKLNRTAFDYAKELIAQGKVVLDERDDWSEHQPSAAQENEFLAQHGWGEFAKWYLGIDDEAAVDTKKRYEFPYGDFNNVHRCGVLSAESRAGQYKHRDIQNAAAHLHGMLDESRVRS
jgi:hypothetical protein